jgi:hypothetical protein
MSAITLFLTDQSRRWWASQKLISTPFITSCSTLKYVVSATHSTTYVLPSQSCPLQATKTKNVQSQSYTSRKNTGEEVPLGVSEFSNPKVVDEWWEPAPRSKHASHGYRSSLPWRTLGFAYGQLERERCHYLWQERRNHRWPMMGPSSPSVEEYVGVRTCRLPPSIGRRACDLEFLSSSCLGRELATCRESSRPAGFGSRLRIGRLIRVTAPDMVKNLPVAVDKISRFAQRTFLEHAVQPRKHVDGVGACCVRISLNDAVYLRLGL